MVRRSFIRNAGLLAGGLLLHDEMARAFSLKGASEKISVGIIGCGDRGRGIIDIMKQLPDRFQVKALCDVLDFRIKEAQAAIPTTKTQNYADYRKLLDDKTIQAVIIATPLNLHFPIAISALDAGKHVYLEKTMTYNISEAKDLVKAVAKFPKLTLQVGHQYRYTPLYYKVKEMIGKGFLGKVTQIDCRWDRNWNWRRPVSNPSLERKINWRMYKEYSGGLAAELLSHQMDFINWAFDTHPDQIIATGGVDFYKDGRETFDNVQAVLRYSEEGMIGNFGATCGNAHDGYLFKLKGTKGTVSLLMNEGAFYPEKGTRKELATVDGTTGATKIEWRADGGIPILKEPAKDGTWYALNDFHKSILTKQPPASNVITGATTSVCVHLANTAMDTNTVQKWNPSYNFS